MPLAKKCCLLLLLHKADPTAAYQPFVRGQQRLGLSYETEGTEGVSVLEQVAFLLLFVYLFSHISSVLFGLEVGLRWVSFDRHAGAPAGAARRLSAGADAKARGFVPRCSVP